MIIDPEQIRAARERLRETCNYTRPATRMPRALVYCALLFMGLGFMCGLASEARSTFSLLPEPSFSLLGDTPAAKGADGKLVVYTVWNMRLLVAGTVRNCRV